MKRILFIMCFALLTVPAWAELTVDDAASPKYLKNHGYSNSSTWAVEKSVANVHGEELEEPVKEVYKYPVIKYVRKFFMYIDPALDDHQFMNNHDINPSSVYTDL